MQSKRKPRLAIVLPRGEAIRNVLYTGMLDRLSADCELYIASVQPCERVWELIGQKAHALIRLGPSKVSYAERLARELIQAAHGRRVWSVATRDRWARREAEATSFLGQVKLRTKRLLAATFQSERGIRFLERTEDRLVRFGEEYRQWQEVFRKWRPDLLFNASHIHGVDVRTLLAAAKHGGTPLAAFVFSWDNLTSQGRILPCYDYYFVWSEWIAEELLRLYPRTGRQQVIVSGTPQFDMHFMPQLRWSREEFCRRLKLDPERPIVLYTTGMPNHMPFEEEIVDDIAERLKSVSGESRPQLIVRVYAKDRSGRFDALFMRRPEIAKVPTFWEEKFLTPLPEDQEWYVNALAHCDAGINVASTVSVELMIHGKPVINIGYDPPGRRIDPISYARYYKYDHYEPLVRMGAVEVVWRPEDLPTTVSRALRDPVKRRKESREALEKLFGPSARGGVAVRLAESLIECAEAARRGKASSLPSCSVIH